MNTVKTIKDCKVGDVVDIGIHKDMQIVKITLNSLGEYAKVIVKSSKGWHYQYIPEYNILTTAL